MVSTKIKQTNQSQQSTGNPVDLGYYYHYYEEVHNDPYLNGLEFYRGTIKIQVEKYAVIRRTPKGVWIRRWSGSNPQTFILTASTKKVAWPTREEAAAHFITRKKNQIQIVERQLNRAKDALYAAAEKWNLSVEKTVTLKDIYGTAALLGEDEPEDDDNDALLP